MFENLYKKGAIDIIHNNFGIGINNELENLAYLLYINKQVKFFNNIFDLNKNNKELKIMENSSDITFGDYENFLQEEKIVDIMFKRSFSISYEVFEKALGEFITYIHYKNPNIVFKKNKGTINLPPKEVEKLISKNVKKILYTRPVTDIIRFIKGYCNLSIDKTILEVVGVFSKLRNYLVHSDGIIEMEDILKIKKFIELEISDGIDINSIDGIDFVPDEEWIEVSIEAYKYIIENISNSMKKVYEIN